MMARQRLEQIDKVVIHYTATPPRLDIGAAEIDEWHKERGWKGIGYHFVVRRDGTVENGRPITTVGAHAYGHNRGSIGIVWVGGLVGDDKGDDTRTPEQVQSLHKLVEGLRMVLPQPVEVVGHRDLADTQCPGGDYVKKEFNP